ncbi:MAG: FtsX-like permease family protein [Mariprofundaceae bacterium]
MKILTLASRNVLRGWHRTLVTTLAMAFACFIMILFASLMEGMIQGSEYQVVSMNMGDIQIHAEGYRDDPDLYTRIDDADGLVASLEQQGFHAASRIYGFGLAAANMASAGVQLRGIDLAHEMQVTQLYKHMGKGEWLDAADGHGVVLGKKLAGALGVDLGDELVFVGQSADGFIANDLFIVRGVLKSVSDGIDRTGMFMPMPALRELMAVPDGAHEIVVLRPDRAMGLTQATGQVAAVAAGLETKNWKQLMPVVARMLETADVQTLIMLVITYIAVAMVILNAMLMSVFERIHEFGIMKAIGVSPWQIVRLIYAETTIQTCVASLLALFSGWWAADYYARYGIDMSSLGGGSISYGGIAFDPIWYAYVTPEAVLTPIVFLFVIVALAVVYPATKAAVIRPVQAIYFR